MLNPTQTQCVLGTLIGDASIYWKRKSSFIYSVSHCYKQKGYLDHISSVLDSARPFLKKPGPLSPPGAEYFKINFQNKECLQPIWDIVTVGGKKIINEDWLNLISPAGIAYWFMDDGCSSYSTSGRFFCRFSTQSYSLSETDLLRELLLRFDVKTNLNKCTGGTGSILSVPADSSEKLMDLINPFVSGIICMSYKLKMKKSVDDNWRRNVKR